MRFLASVCLLLPIGGQTPLVRRSLALAALAWLAACGPDGPVVCGTVPDQTLNVNDYIVVQPCFEDPGMGKITLRAESSNPEVAAVTVQSQVVSVQGISPGSATIIVTATDPDMLTAEAVFSVVVPNRPPGTRGTIRPELIVAGQSVRWGLSEYFFEPDGEELVYSAEAANADVVLVSVSGDTLTATGNAAGVATITVTATDPGGLTATQAVEVTVAEAERLFRDDFDSNESLAVWGFNDSIVEPTVADGVLWLMSVDSAFLGTVVSPTIPATGWEATTAMGNASDLGWAGLMVVTGDPRFSLYLFQFGEDGGGLGLGHTNFRFLVLDEVRGGWIYDLGWVGISDVVPEIGEMAEASMSVRSGRLRAMVGNEELVSVDLRDYGLPEHTTAVVLSVWPDAEKTGGAEALFDWVEVTGVSTDGRVARQHPINRSLAEPLKIRPGIRILRVQKLGDRGKK